ncbi:MAG: T9SS type A sorting domain-containing protein [Bacteroidetes bacterium]|nr:T9SS type A sorting domain-containing protein [Bacteroidota bacterium]
MRSFTQWLLATSLLMLPVVAFSQQPCMPILQTDTSEILFDGTVFKVATGDSTLYIGGNFRSVGKHSGGAIYIDKNNGKPIGRYAWPKIYGTINSVPDGSGGWVLYGSFRRKDDTTRYCLATLNNAGFLQLYYTTTDGTINSAAVNNGVLYIGGSFTKVNGVSRNRLAALSMTNQALTSWNPNITNAGQLVPQVLSMFYYNNNLYIGGIFTHIGAAVRRNLAAVDISTGVATSWNPAVYFTTSPLDGIVNRILKVGNLVYVAGRFDNVGGNAKNNLAAVDISTGSATSWNPAPDYNVFALANKGDTLYVGGNFKTISSTPKNGFAAYSIVSGNLLPINIDVKIIFTERINDIAVLGDSLYIGGGFDTINNQYRRNIAAFNRLTGAMLPWTSHTNDEVLDVYADNGQIFVSGNFSSVARKLRNNIAELDLKSDTITKWNPIVNDSVFAINVIGNKVYIGGAFSNVNDSARNYNAALDAVTGNTLAWNPKADGAIYSIVKNSSNQYYAGGVFAKVNGMNKNGIAQLDSMGMPASWTGINTAGSKVYCLLINNGKLFVGGEFTDITGTTRTNLGAINLSTGLCDVFNPVLLIANTHTFTIPPVKNIHPWGAGIAVPGRIFTQSGMNGLGNYYILGFVTTSPSTGSYLYASVPEPINDFQISGIRTIVAGDFKTIIDTPTVHIQRTQTSKLLALIDIATGFSSPFTSPFNWGDHANTIGIYGNKMYVGGDFHDGYLGSFSGLSFFNLSYTMPQISIKSDTNNFCDGYPVTLTASSNISYGASLHWTKNDTVVGNNTKTYSYVPKNGDWVYCILDYPNNGCYANIMMPSDTVKYKVMGYVTPEITISSVNVADINATVVVRAKVKNAATGYSIEWFNNKTSMGKTTVDSFVYFKTTGIDSIWAVITPRTDTCYVTDTSNAMWIVPTAVTRVSGNDDIKIYPNPFDRYVIINELSAGDVILLYDITGKGIKEATVIANNTTNYVYEINDVTKGTYNIQIKDKRGQLKKTALLQKH